MPYRNSFTTINKNYFKKIRHHLFKNQSLELSSLSEIDNIIQEEEEIVKKNPTVYLQIYIPILYVATMSQNKNDSINSTS